MKLLLPTACCFLLIWGDYTLVYAQENFSADRPGFADAPDILPPANFQIGYGFQWDKIDRHDFFQLPTGTLRYGITPSLELRANYALPYGRRTGLQLAPLGFGMKVKMLEEQNFVPGTSVMLFVAPKGIGSPNCRRPTGAAVLSYLLPGQSPPEPWLFTTLVPAGYNIGASWDGISPASQWNQLINLTYAPSPPLNLSLEVYHEFFETETPNWASDVAVSYQLTKSFQVDASVGIDLLDPANFFVNAGATYQYMPPNPLRKRSKTKGL